MPPLPTLEDGEQLVLDELFARTRRVGGSVRLQASLSPDLQRAYGYSGAELTEVIQSLVNKGDVTVSDAYITLTKAGYIRANDPNALKE